MGILNSLKGFEEFSKKVNIRRFSKTRKVRKSEDELFYTSIREPISISEMVSVRPLAPDIEDKLDQLNKLFVTVRDPILKRVYLLEYDILIEKSVGDLDEDDVIAIYLMQKELFDCIKQVGLPLGEVEKFCLSRT